MKRYLPLAGYVSSIWLANWALGHVGWCPPDGPCVVPVGFGLWAPSGVLFAGLAFTLRDLTQESLGKAWTVAAIGIGALLSLAIAAPFVAVASGVAFLVSELCDMAVYTPIRRRHWLTAVALSNSVGLVVDSALFLQLAFGSLEFLAGQVVGKFLTTVVAVGALWIWRRRGALLARHAQAAMGEAN